MAAVDVCRVNKIVAQVRNILKKQFLVAQRDVAEQNEVLVNLPHVAHVRHEAHRELAREHDHREPFADAGEAGAVGLHDSDRPGL